MSREDGLISLGVFGFDLFADPPGQGGLPEGEERLFELLVGSVEEEPEGSSPGGGVVDDLGDEQVVVSEVEFVSDSDLSGGVDEHVPEPEFAVEFAEEEYFDFGTGFLLVSVEASGEYLGVVEYEEVLFVEIFDDVLENAVFDGTFRAVDDHQTGFVPIFGRIFGQHFGGKIVPVLR